MRRCNAAVSVVILILLAIHGVAGGFQLMGVFPGGNPWLKALSWTMIGFLCLHVLIGVYLTIESLIRWKRSGKGYFRENLVFWIRRISGFAMILFVVLHTLLFLGKSGEAYRLNLFAGPQLVMSILLLVCLAVHLVTNIKPLMLSLGARGAGRFVKDVLLLISVVLLFAAAAFIVYYFRWNLM